MSMALALLRVTARMYTSLWRMYRKEQDPSTRTGAAEAAPSSLALRMCVLKAVPKFLLQQQCLLVTAA